MAPVFRLQCSLLPVFVAVFGPYDLLAIQALITAIGGSVRQVYIRTREESVKAVQHDGHISHDDNLSC